MGICPRRERKALSKIPSSFPSTWLGFRTLINPPSWLAQRYRLLISQRPSDNPFPLIQQTHPGILCRLLIDQDCRSPKSHETEACHPPERGQENSMAGLSVNY